MAHVASEEVAGSQRLAAPRLRALVLGSRGGSTTRRRASDAFRLGLAVIVVAWSFLPGVQAMADGVVLHAWLDLLGAVTAALTAVLVVHLTRLLGPFRTTRRELVVALSG